MDWKPIDFQGSCLGQLVVSCWWTRPTKPTWPSASSGPPQQVSHVERSQPSLPAGLWRKGHSGIGKELSSRVQRAAGAYLCSVKTYELRTLLCKNLEDKTTSEVAKIETWHYFNYTVTFYSHFSSIQVMQFGRIDNNAYTLDFQYPFTAVQAFAVALANVTQRLKWTKKLKLPT